MSTENAKDKYDNYNKNAATMNAAHVFPPAHANSVSRQGSQTTREECIAFLSKGSSLQDLSDACREILGANSKIGILARRNSAVGRVWSPSEGHNARSYVETTFGSPTDIPKDSKSMGEIFLENKTPEQAEKIKKTIARTASRGAKVRTDDVITPEHIEKQAREIQLERRSSRERQGSH